MKRVEVSISGLSEAVMKELEEYGEGVNIVVEKAAERACMDAQSELQEKSPKKSGKYADDWHYKNETKGKGKIKFRIYNGKPGLVHLLENGHALKRGGRVVGRARAFKHVAPVQKSTEQNFEKLIREELEK